MLLLEQNDLASGTSSASTKLIHGGLRYLEHGWFRLVREALAEREVMLRIAPRIAISGNYKYSVRGLVDDIHAGFVTSGVSGDVARLTEALRAGDRLPSRGP